MDGCYDILLGNEPIGKVRVERQGLYYRFFCRCKLSGTVIYRLTVSCNGHHENLGIPVPEGDWFTLNAKLPVKRLGKGAPSFLALPKHRSGSGQFVPVYPEEPFAYLHRLQEAFMQVREGQAGVVLPE